MSNIDAENERLKRQEKFRENKRLTVSSTEFQKVARPGEPIREGQTRSNSPALEDFKNMLEKKVEGVSLFKYAFGRPGEEAILKHFEKMICPSCGESLIKGQTSREWVCNKCDQKYMDDEGE